MEVSLLFCQRKSKANPQITLCCMLVKWRDGHQRTCGDGRIINLWRPGGDYRVLSKRFWCALKFSLVLWKARDGEGDPAVL